MSSEPVPGRALERATDSSVYEIVAGKVRRGTIRTRLPEQCRESGVFFAPAPLMPYLDAKIAVITEIVSRCAPWLHVLAGPALRKTADGPLPDLSAFREVDQGADGRLTYSVSGCAWHFDGQSHGQSPLIAIRTALGLTLVKSTVHHELWHAIEEHLSDEELAIVTAAALKGDPMPGSYLDSAVERRARLYEHFASYIDFGGACATVNGQIALPLQGVFWRVYSGELSRDVTTGRQGCAAVRRGPTRSRVAASTRSPPPGGRAHAREAGGGR
jgi:hypothetical protein